ncbi:MAG: HEAT repeat domain-containing protein [Deltaproteobacteria bacterium]|nr:HEAT repeat domain-containing protein [Deltaproteobacteria bacterium]
MKSVVGLFTVLFASPLQAGPCERAQVGLDALVLELDGEWAIRLAPYVSSVGVGPLAGLVWAKDESRATWAAIVLGMSRQSNALSALREEPRGAAPMTRLGRALGLLALGDGAGTGSIAEAIENGSPEQRRLVAQVLGKQRTMRAGALLAPLLRDPDPEARLWAARRGDWWKPQRARKALEELADWPEPEIHRPAARTLATRRIHGRWLRVLPLPERARFDARRLNREASVAALRSALKEVDALAIPSALGVAAAAGVKTPILKRIVGDRAPGELFMLRWLEGDPEALAGIAQVDAPNAKNVIVLLFAYSGGDSSRLKLTKEKSSELVPSFERFIVTKTVDDVVGSWAIRALDRLEPNAALALARTRVLGPEGIGQRSAMRVIGRHGDSPVEVLLAGERSRDKATRAVALRAALDVCRRL